MASVVSHAAVALALGTAFRRPGPPARFWIIGAACAVVPDLDVIGLRLGVPYASVFGHRGFTHSLTFAVLLAFLALVAFRDDRWRRERVRLWFYFFLCAASHGVLDAMTTGGLGVAFFAPFDGTRFFLPWRPIQVSPISVRRFFTVVGITVFRSEARWVWLPAGLFALAMIAARWLWARRGEREKGR